MNLSGLIALSALIQEKKEREKLVRAIREIDLCIWTYREFNLDKNNRAKATHFMDQVVQSGLVIDDESGTPRYTYADEQSRELLMSLISEQEKKLTQ